jgi:hypothetical protein
MIGGRRTARGIKKKHKEEYTGSDRFFTPEGAPRKDANYEPHVGNGFCSTDAADIDRDGRDEIYGAISVTGTFNYDVIAYVNVTYKLKMATGRSVLYQFPASTTRSGICRIRGGFDDENNFARVVYCGVVVCGERAGGLCRFGVRESKDDSGARRVDVSVYAGPDVRAWRGHAEEPFRSRKVI